MINRPEWKKHILKWILRGIGSLLIVFMIWMLTPRVLSYIFPDRLPVGYGSDILTYLAVETGLEPLINMSPDLPDGIHAIENVVYKVAGDKELAIDFYRPKGEEELLPLLIFVHGGGWKGGKRQDYLVYLHHFAQQGYMTATVSYRLVRDSIYPAAAEDVRDAVRWIFGHSDRFQFDPDRTALIGGSAGAHLVMLTAFGWGEPEDVPVTFADAAGIPRQIKALVDIYGPVDLTSPQAKKHHLVSDFLGYTFDENPEIYREASPVNYLKSSAPVTLILHGTSDKLVPAGQSELLRSKLSQLGVPVEYHRFPLWPHAMDMSVRANRFTTKMMEEFFERQLNP